MRTVISWAMTKCENGEKRSIMLTDVKTAFLYGDARRLLFIELHPGDPRVSFFGKLERAVYGTRDAQMIWQDHLRETLLDMNPKESVTGCFNMKLETFFSACSWTICCAQVYVTNGCG